jgi:membrane-bound metal-dependent hydrolase YbcI (DUF457 family)
LHYVLIAGLAGILPDFDMAVYYILGIFGFSLESIHRTFSHSLFFVLIFLILGLFFLSTTKIHFKRYRIKLSTLFLVICFGVAFHLFLDYLIVGNIMPFYPLLEMRVGLNLITLIPELWRASFIPVVDSFLLIFWLSYLELKHRISDFI